MPQMREIASGLKFPEGPVAMSDGNVLVVEITRGTLTRVRPNGSKEVVAETGGGPNGAAFGPDGKVYVCNNGGLKFTADGHPTEGLPDGYTGGYIQRVDIDSGKVEVLYTECNGHRLRGPNDIVFDATGGFWFSDFGKLQERQRDRTGALLRQSRRLVDQRDGLPHRWSQRHRPRSGRYAAVRRSDL